MLIVIIIRGLKNCLSSDRVPATILNGFDIGILTKVTIN